MTPQELRNQFKKETETNWENSQGEPEIDYIYWLEEKIISLADPEKSEQEIIEAYTKVVGDYIKNRKKSFSLFPEDRGCEYCGMANGIHKSDCSLMSKIKS